MFVALVPQTCATKESGLPRPRDVGLWGICVHELPSKCAPGPHAPAQTSFGPEAQRLVRKSGSSCEAFGTWNSDDDQPLAEVQRYSVPSGVAAQTSSLVRAQTLTRPASRPALRSLQAW